MDATGPVPFNPAIWNRATLLGKLAFGRVARVSQVMMSVALGASLLIGITVVAAPDAGLAWLISAGIVCGVALVGAASLRDPGVRAAVELLADHQCHELDEWKRETGTKMPRGRIPAQRWLQAHPEAPGRLSLLVPLGRFEEADLGLERRPPTTIDRQFDAEVTRQYRTLLVGGTPDLVWLHDAWRRLPEPREQRHRRECLAILEAQVARDDGRDPVTVLAEARREVGVVYWRFRAPVLVAWWSLTLLALASALVLVRIGLTPA